MDIIELRRGRTRATVLPEAGGRIHQIEVRPADAWLPLLLAPDDPATVLREPREWGCYPMVPWPGRIEGGRFLFAGRQYEAPVNSPEGHALHGFGASMPWRVESQSGDRCRLSVEFGEAWGFGGRAVQEIAADDRGVTMRVEVRATRPGAFPAGAGWHPWFRRDVVPGAKARVLVDADHTYETVDMIPTGWLKRVDGDVDLRSFPLGGDRRIDACYRAPRRTAIAWGDLELEMASSPNIGHAVVYTPARGICVEPQTCAPDAFNLHEQQIEGCGMAVVTPRRPLVATTAWRWREGVLA